MLEFWQAWQSLDLAAQAEVDGVAASVVTGLLKRIWPSFADSTGAVKQYLLAALAGVSTYIATGNVLAAVVAFCAAIGGYEVYKEQIVKRVAAKKAS